MGERFLILDSVSNDWTDCHMAERENVCVDAIYSQQNFKVRILRRLYFLLNLPFKNIWYGNWKNKLKEYDYIIIFSALLERDIFRYIRKIGYEKHLIYYYRDPLSSTKYNPAEIKKSENNLDIWTFDKQDAMNNNIKYNPQFYFYLKNKPQIILYDVVFVGSARNRLSEILKTKDLFSKMGLKLYFYIKKQKYKKYDINEQKNLYGKSLSYEKILNLDMSSKCILEINQPGQNGMTVRSMEALFLERKLITNNLAMKKMDFYVPENIFILGNDNIDGLKKFLMIPYKKIDENIRRQYCFEEWLKRFIKSKNLA